MSERDPDASSSSFAHQVLQLPAEITPTDYQGGEKKEVGAAAGAGGVVSKKGRSFVAKDGCKSQQQSSDF